MKNSKQNNVPDPVSYISMIHVEADSIDHPVTREILSRAGDIPVKIISASDDYVTGELIDN